MCNRGPLVRPWRPLQFGAIMLAPISPVEGGMCCMGTVGSKLAILLACCARCGCCARGVLLRACAVNCVSVPWCTPELSSFPSKPFSCLSLLRLLPSVTDPPLPQSTLPTLRTAAGGRLSTLGALRSWLAHLPPRWCCWVLGWRWSRMYRCPSSPGNLFTVRARAAIAR